MTTTISVSGAEMRVLIVGREDLAQNNSPPDVGQLAFRKSLPATLFAIQPYPERYVITILETIPAIVNVKLNMMIQPLRVEAGKIFHVSVDSAHFDGLRMYSTLTSATWTLRLHMQVPCYSVFQNDERRVTLTLRQIGGTCLVLSRTERRLFRGSHLVVGRDWIDPTFRSLVPRVCIADVVYTLDGRIRVNMLTKRLLRLVDLAGPRPYWRKCTRVELLQYDSEVFQVCGISNHTIHMSVEPLARE